MSDAPTCFIAPPKADIQQLTKTLAAVPAATDLNSALAAINALTRMLQALIGQLSHDNGNNGGDFGKGFNPGPPPPPSKPPAWTELNRATKKIRVHNPDDPTQFVDITVISSLTMINRRTGETWQFKQ